MINKSWLNYYLWIEYRIRYCPYTDIFNKIISIFCIRQGFLVLIAECSKISPKQIAWGVNYKNMLQDKQEKQKTWFITLIHALTDSKKYSKYFHVQHKHPYRWPTFFCLSWFTMSPPFFVSSLTTIHCRSGSVMVGPNMSVIGTTRWPICGFTVSINCTTESILTGVDCISSGKDFSAKQSNDLLNYFNIY